MDTAIQKRIRAASRQLREPVLERLFISIPLVPPSVNHYKRPKASGKGFYVTEEAKAFKLAVACLSKGSVQADQYFVAVAIYLAKGQRGDAGNFEKCIGDGLQDAGIIRNDSQIKKYQIEVSRDWDEPRTEILVVPLYRAFEAKLERRLPPARITQPGTDVPHESGRPKLCACHGAAICIQRGA